VRAQLAGAVGERGLEFRLVRTDRADPDTIETASALLHVHLKDSDPTRAGRAFTSAAVELALASYPGCTLTSPPREIDAVRRVHRPYVAQGAVAHTAVLPDGTRVAVPPPPCTGPAAAPPRRPPAPARRTRRWDHRRLGPHQTLPLGTIAGARSGDRAATPTSASGSVSLAPTRGCADT
jgi:hypothetical protein